MQQTAIVHSERITKKGELKYFQVPLPGKHKRITAVEASAFVLEVTAAIPEPESGNGGSGPAPISNCPNPGTASIDQVSDTMNGGIRTQVFKVGAAVNPGFIFSCGVYSVVITITAVDGDSPATIAAKLAVAVSTTSLATWKQYGSNNQNYKPTGSANGDLLTLTTDTQHSFFASGFGSCGLEPPPPAIVQYDALFTVKQHEKVGLVTLQSPDVTDIFWQMEVFRQDRNISFADFSFSGLMVGEWLQGKKHLASEILITTGSPIIEVYYKDALGLLHNKDLAYQVNLFIWLEKEFKA